ncbi:MAG: nuclear transport factor 2 family protein [Rhodospirillaceae bacterium]|nr:nuclear transport factor 2 family protein [Rhodospirillaceae bacterium]
MSEDDRNVAVLQESYTLWNSDKAAGFDYWMQLLADDVTFRSLAGGRPGVEFTRDCNRKADVARYFEGLTADWEMVHYTPVDFIAQGGRVAVRGRTAWKNRRSGKTVSTPKADFFRFRDGKIVEFFEFYDTAAMLAAAG